MYAIVELKGEQFKVEDGSVIYSPLTDKKDGEDIIIDKILFIKDAENDIGIIGNPYIDGAKVKGTVDKMVKGKKVNLFKYKKRKKYRRKIGHRPKYHKITINNIETK